MPVPFQFHHGSKRNLVLSPKPHYLKGAHLSQYRECLAVAQSIETVNLDSLFSLLYIHLSEVPNLELERWLSG